MSQWSRSLFKVALDLAFKAVNFHDKAKFFEKYFHDTVTVGKSDTILTLVKGSMKIAYMA